MKSVQIGNWVAARWIVFLTMIGWTANVAALHPIQHNWEFQFVPDTERPFFVSAGESGVGQRAKLDGAIRIDDHDHGMPILRDLNLRLTNVVSVIAATGEIIDPIRVDGRAGKRLFRKLPVW